MSLKPSFAGFALVTLLTATPVLAESPPGERALAVSAADSQLKWGPCPPFMPEGCGLAVLHGDPAKPNADVFLKIPPGQAIPHHWHTSAERMVLVSGTLEVSYDGQPSATLTPGMYAYGPSKHPHSAACGKGEACVLFIAFEAPVDAMPTAGSKE